MTFSIWDRVAALIEPPLVLLLEATAPLRAKERKDMDDYKPPREVSDYFELRFCREPCWAETMHHVINWVSGEVTGECRDCGGIVEIEGLPE